jgi:rod shape-determining protein MreC
VALSRRTARPRFILLLLVLTAITLITLDQRSGGHGFLNRARGSLRDAYTPVASTVKDGLRPVGDFLHEVFHYGDLQAENARLREQLAEARVAQLSAADDERRLRELIQQQHLDFVGDIPTVAAQVFGTTASNFEMTIEINRGSDAGVGVGMPVVAASGTGSPGGLLGRVVEVSATRATVLLLTDPTSHVAVRFPNNDEGIVTGTGPGSPLRVELVDPKTLLHHGDVLSTSGGQAGLYPAGIPVGTVRTASHQPGVLEQDVTLDPIVDSSSLEFVQVLEWAPR